MIIPALALVVLVLIFMQNKKNGEKEESGGGGSSGFCSEGIRCGNKRDLERIIKDFRTPVWLAKFVYPSVPRSWIFAIIAWESGGNNYRYNPADPSAGCMQILDTTARAINPNINFPQDLYNAYTCVKMGTYLMSTIIQDYGMDIVELYAHYNGGHNPPAISYDRGKCVEELARRFGNYINILD